MENAVFCCKPFHKIKQDNATISLALKGPTTYKPCQTVESPNQLDASKKNPEDGDFLLVLMVGIKSNSFIYSPYQKIMIPFLRHACWHLP